MMTKLRYAVATLLAVCAFALIAQGQWTVGAICNDGTQVSSATGCSFHGGIHCVLFSDGSCR